MSEMKQAEQMADRLAQEAKGIAQSIRVMEEERMTILQRADSLTADILRAQGALGAVKKLAEVGNEEIE